MTIRQLETNNEKFMSAPFLTHEGDNARYKSKH